MTARLAYGSLQSSLAPRPPTYGLKGAVCRAASAALMLATFATPRVGFGQAPAPRQDQVSANEQIEAALNAAEERISQLEKNAASGPDASQKFTEATQLVDQVLQYEPLSKRAGYLKGRLAILRNRPREALPLIQEYANATEGATDWFAQKLLGDLYVPSYPEQARTRYKDAIELAPDQPASYIGLANAEIKLSRGEDAVASARKAITLDTEETVKYREVLARALLLLPDGQDEAANAARDAVAITERRIRETPGNLVLLDTLMKEYELLFDCYSELAHVKKDSPDVVVSIVRTAQDKADLERLIAYHSALIVTEQSRKNPAIADSIELMFEEARLNRMVGRKERAIEVLNELLEKRPNHEGARELLRLLNGAKSGDPAQDGTTADAKAHR